MCVHSAFCLNEYSMTVLCLDCKPRDSGSQKRALIRDRKIREGTWTVEKPPRKTPPSQDKGTTGCSGGVKRPHPDSSTPSLEKQQPKKPRNTQVQTET
jgi:hypothetical protein